MFKYQDYLHLLDKVREKTDFKPEIGAVLGSGLGSFADKIDIVCSIGYDELPGLPLTTNKAHKGRFVFGYFEDIPLVLMQGRLHYYEGYTSEEIVRPIRLMKMMGIKSLILTNAAGGVNTSFKPGDIMLIDDHISTPVPSPLIGENIDEFGVFGADMKVELINDGPFTIMLDSKELMK